LSELALNSPRYVFSFSRYLTVSFPFRCKCPTPFLLANS
jgi:hypothetical protein